MSLTRTSPPSGGRTIGDTRSELTKRLIREGCSGTVAPSISTDGPNAITDERRWLARQLLDSKLTDAEAFGIVAHHPAIKQERAA